MPSVAVENYVGEGFNRVKFFFLLEAISKIVVMLRVSETTCLLLATRFVLAFLLAADKVLQSYARNLRTPALKCAQDDRRIFEITSSKIPDHPMNYEAF